MRIHDLPTAERPREKLLARGAHALSDAELLAILLRNGTAKYSAIEIASQLLQQFGSLRNVLKAPLHDFLKIKGIGKTHYIQFQAAFSLSQRIFEQQFSENFSLKNFDSLEKFLLQKLSLREQEVFAVIFLNSKMEFICYEELFYGSIRHTEVHPRELIKRALFHNASAIILAHNHPSGDPSPSPEDHHLTEVLQDSLKWLDIKIVQHVIVGRWHCEAIEK